MCVDIFQVIFMTNFLEANHYKIAKCLAELDGSTKPSHMFAKYIEQNRDKQVRVIDFLHRTEKIHILI